MREHNKSDIVKKDAENFAAKSVEDAMRFQARPTNATITRGSSAPQYIVREGINMRHNEEFRPHLQKPQVFVKRDVI